jgi:hypothetical protein
MHILTELGDERFDHGSYVRSFGNLEWLAQYTLRGSFPVTHRDFAVIHSQYEDPTSGTMFLYATSIDDPLIPSVPGRVRGHLYLAGWVLRPHPTQTDTLIATYIVNLDVRGALPQTLIHALTQSMAACVGTVSRFLNKWGYPTHIVFPTNKPASRIKVLAESFTHRGAVYDLVYRVTGSGPSILAKSGVHITQILDEYEDLSIRCCKRMYTDGLIVELRTRGRVEWCVVDDEDASKVVSVPIVVDDDIMQEVRPSEFMDFYGEMKKKNEEKVIKAGKHKEVTVAVVEANTVRRGWRIRITMAEGRGQAVQTTVRRLEEDKRRRARQSVMMGSWTRMPIT